MSKKIKEIATHNLDSEQDKQLLQRIKEWLGCYFTKHGKTEAEVTARDFEPELLKRLKMFVIADSKDLFWHFFFGKHLEYKLTDLHHDFERKEVFLELDFPAYKGEKVKPRLLIFQRKTHPEYYFG